MCFSKTKNKNKNKIKYHFIPCSSTFCLFLPAIIFIKHPSKSNGLKLGNSKTFNFTNCQKAAKCIWKKGNTGWHGGSPYSDFYTKRCNYPKHILCTKPHSTKQLIYNVSSLSISLSISDCLLFSSPISIYILFQIIFMCPFKSIS